MKKIVILGGGTFQHVRNHLSIAAPAFGQTARLLHQLLPHSTLFLTKMADSSSRLVTNEDVAKKVKELVEDHSVGTIILNVAFCDYSGEIGEETSGKYAERLRTSEGNQTMRLSPAPKIIPSIRKNRKDIFLVGFKTTTNKTEEEQFRIGLKMLKSSSCNLVFANDTTTRNNLIITPEETFYCSTTDRKKAVEELAELVLLRNNLSYDRTIFTQQASVPLTKMSSTFQAVLQHCIAHGGYQVNDNGFTAGHFCQRIDQHAFYSSQRKTNHNEIDKNGLCRVEIRAERFYAFGEHLPSVGARSQWLLLKNNPDFDCVIHTHNPLKFGSLIPTTPQRPYQCGSLECGMNTLNHLGSFGEIKAVFLEKHGANILFKSTSRASSVIAFIEENIALGKKTR